MPRVVMPFGKYKGEHPEDVPVEYLEWALENWEDIDSELQDEMEAQIAMKHGLGASRGKTSR